MEEFIEFETPIECLRRLIVQDNSEEFHLCVKLQAENAKEIQIQTTLNKIRTISRKIDQICQIDPTISQYELKIPYNFKEDDVQEQTELLIKSIKEKVKIPQSKQNIFSLIQFLLGSQEEKIIYKINNIQEAISLLSTDMHDKSIEYLSNNLLELIESGTISSIDEQISKDIIDLYFEDEKSKSSEEINKIYTKLMKDEDEKIIMHFLLHVEDELYSKEMIEYILDHMSDEIMYDELGQITRKLRYHLSTIKPKNVTECQFKGNQLDGIISHMKKTINDNLCESGSLKITGGGDNSPSWPISNLIKYDSSHIDECYYNYLSNAPAKKDGWIEFDFLERKVNLTSYTLRSKNGKGGCDNFAKSWRILGSNDEKSWDLLDQRTNDSTLHGQGKQNRFEIKQNDKYYQYIKYIQDDSSHSNDNCHFEYYVFFTCIEFFGSILECK